MILKHIQRIFVKKKESPNSPDYQRRRKKKKKPYFYNKFQQAAKIFLNFFYFHIWLTTKLMWLNLLVDDGQSVWLHHKIENKNPVCPNIIKYTAVL
jgi:hypothetical protein